jgi:hypothetical protein
VQRGSHPVAVNQALWLRLLRPWQPNEGTTFSGCENSSDTRDFTSNHFRTGLVRKLVKAERGYQLPRSGRKGFTPPEFPFQYFYLRLVKRFTLEQFLCRTVQQAPVCF